MAGRARSRKRGGENQALIYLQLARPHFLAGGFLLFGLGATIARYERVPISGGLYVAGQALVTCLQLMTHFLNEYWDVESDRPNPNRTWFSGGSGVLPAGLMSRDTAFMLAVLCLAGATVSAVVLAVTLQVTFIPWLIILAAGLGSWFYSSPPLRLAASGFGEFTTSLLVAVLLPAFGYSLQAGTVSPLVWLSAAPLFMFHVAMLLSFEVPDGPSDAATGKRTLYVRLGRSQAVWLHRLLLALGYGLLAAAGAAGVPLLVVLSGALAFPLALVQTVAFPWLAAAAETGGDPPLPYGALTVAGVSLFAGTAGLMTLGFWRVG